MEWIHHPDLIHGHNNIGTGKYSFTSVKRYHHELDDIFNAPTTWLHNEFRPLHEVHGPTSPSPTHYLVCLLSSAQFDAFGGVRSLVHMRPHEAASLPRLLACDARNNKLLYKMDHPSATVAQWLHDAGFRVIDAESTPEGAHWVRLINQWANEWKSGELIQEIHEQSKNTSIEQSLTDSVMDVQTYSCIIFTVFIFMYFLFHFSLSSINSVRPTQRGGNKIDQ